jgi:hypothetical protein
MQQTTKRGEGRMSSPWPDLGFFARHSTVRRSVALLLAAVLSAGCTAWRPTTAGSEALMARHPREVRVSLERGGRVVLYAPAVAGDSLVGYREYGVNGSRIAIPLRDVTLTEVWRVNVVNTVALAGAVTFGMVLLAGLAEFRSHTWLTTRAWPGAR